MEELIHFRRLRAGAPATTTSTSSPLPAASVNNNENAEEEIAPRSKLSAAASSPAASAAATATKKLNTVGDWEIFNDQASGRNFFFNKREGLTQWEKPAEIDLGDFGEKEKDKEIGGLTSTSASASASEIWKEYKDARSGRIYYFNEITKESTWVKPSSAAASFDEDEWEKLRDPETKKEFYFNKRTGKTSWTVPAATPPSSSSTISSPPGEILRQKSIHLGFHAPSHWEKLQDPVTGRVFFHHRLKGVSQWERPEELGTWSPSTSSSISPERITPLNLSQASTEKEPNWAKMRSEGECLGRIGLWDVMRFEREIFYYGNALGTGQYERPQDLQVEDVKRILLSAQKEDVTPSATAKRKESHVPSRETTQSDSHAVEQVSIGGYLKKKARGGFQNWQSRYFTIRGHHLKYFQSEDDAETDSNVLSSIDLRRIYSVQNVPGTENDFAIFEGKDDILITLQAQNSSERLKWVHQLRMTLPSSPSRQRDDDPESEISREEEPPEQVSVVQPPPRRSNFTTPSRESNLFLTPTPIKATAVRNYTAKQDDELSFVAGDTIEISRQNRGDNFWFGRVLGDSGGGRIGRFQPQMVSIPVDEGAAPPSRGSGDPPTRTRSTKNVSSGVRSQMHQFTKRMERKKKLERLNEVLDSLGVLAYSFTLPTVSALRKLADEVEHFNEQAHILKACSLGSQWISSRSTDLHLAEVKEAGDIPSDITVNFAHLWNELKCAPNSAELLVGIGNELKPEAQLVFATSLASSFYDSVSSADSIEFVRLLQEAYKSNQQGSAFYGSLVIAFSKRSEVQEYITQTLLNSDSPQIQEAQMMLSNFDYGVADDLCIRICQAVVEVALMQESLLSIPESVSLMFASFESTNAARTFAVEAVFLPAITNKHLGDLQSVQQTQLERIFECVLQEELLIRFPSRLQSFVRKIRADIDELILFAIGSISKKFQDTSKHKFYSISQRSFVVASCFELYMLHLAVDTFAVRRSRRSSHVRLPSTVLDLLQNRLGPPRPLPAPQNGNPFIVLELPRRLHHDEEGPSFVTQPGINEQIARVLERAIALVASTSGSDDEDGNNFDEDEEEMIESLTKFSNVIKRSFHEQQQLMQGLIRAKSQYNKFLTSGKVDRQRASTATSPTLRSSGSHRTLSSVSHQHQNISTSLKSMSIGVSPLKVQKQSSPPKRRYQQQHNTPPKKTPPPPPSSSSAREHHRRYDPNRATTSLQRGTFFGTYTPEQAAMLRRSRDDQDDI